MLVDASSFTAPTRLPFAGPTAEGQGPRGYANMLCSGPRPRALGPLETGRRLANAASCSRRSQELPLADSPCVPNLHPIYMVLSPKMRRLFRGNPDRPARL
jgi:hypothetical protein